ncbi:hypothetical protein WBJ53_31530 [Spirosoma sp. SC4-14]|uniref:hypothetical protein n=1 Tax=Spirosoma sp. SC4-14 TaxID=3128900 RepID=UPI0030D2A27C
MENEKEDRFRRLIQKAGPDKPGNDFTNALMKRVQAESELDLANEASLIQLFQAHTLIEKPSTAFNRRVMNQLVISQSKPLAPIIRPRIWYMMVATLVLIVLFCVLLFPVSPPQPTSSGLDRFLSSVERSLEALPISYPLTLFAVSVLMVVDYFLRPNLTIKYQGD